MEGLGRDFGLFRHSFNIYSQLFGFNSKEILRTVRLKKFLYGGGGEGFMALPNNRKSSLSVCLEDSTERSESNPGQSLG